MTTKQLVTNFLTEVPASRERKNRARTIWRILERKYSPMESMSMDKFIMYQPEIESLSRIIRQVQEEREDLRGQDYGDKVALEQSTMLSLGYSVGHHDDVKKLQAITN